MFPLEGTLGASDFIHHREGHELVVVFLLGSGFDFIDHVEEGWGTVVDREALWWMEEALEGGATEGGVPCTVIAGTEFKVIIGHTEAEYRRHLEGLATLAVTGG